MSDYLSKQPVRNDGVYDGAENENPSTSALVASERNATIDLTTLNKRPTAKDGDENKIALDVALSDGDGNSINLNNPLPTYPTDAPGTEIENYQEDVDVTKDGGTANHDYVTSAEFRSLNAEASSAGLGKFELQVETGVATGVFNTLMTKFNSTSNTNVVFAHRLPAPVASGVTIRMIKTNLEKGQDTDMYSLINGLEV